MSASASASSSQNRNPAGTNTGHQHELVQAEDAILHKCEGCRDDMCGLGLSFKCTHCTKYFHGACLNAKSDSTKPYPFPPNFPLKFSTEKTAKRCDACWGSINGIMYTASHADKDYYLHPQCLELSPNLGCKDMNSELELKRYPEMPTNMECGSCKTSNGKGWCYGIVSNGEIKFAYHVHCLKDKLVTDWLRGMIPLKMAVRKQYYKSLYRKDLEKVKKVLRGSASVVGGVGLDLVTSAFVLAPFSTIISATFGVLTEFAGKKL